jgi:hypothetical protein
MALKTADSRRFFPQATADFRLDFALQHIILE